MDSQRAVKLLDETFNQEFDIDRFAIFINELFNHFNFKKDFKKNSVPLSKEYYEYIEKLQSLGLYRDSNNETIEVFAVKLKRDSSVEKARTMQRNSIANYLKKFNRNASLVAFYGDNPEDWRFSFVKVDYELFKDEKGNLKVDEKLTPAKRYSFLVGKNEPNHTCKNQFLPLIEKENLDPTLEEIEKSFSIENVTKEFFNEYKELYIRLKESLDEVIENDSIIKAEFDDKNIIAADFAKKLMGQIVFIYFLQKKGWLGVEMDQEWGTGPKNFLRILYNKKNYENFFNDVLEHLFYDALSTDRYEDYYQRFECKIPFLNGGLFEPINLYNWYKTDIKIDNTIFGDILDTFDRFNFTVKEDEPLERIVAVDPEMLGKVFENLLEVKDRKSKGAFYTPREIVHYMCQKSLINYLYTNSDIPKVDLELFIQLGDFALDSIIRAKELHQSSKGYALPNSIKDNYDLIDKLLKEVKIADPAVGSGAFLVGMMNEVIKALSILSLLKDEKNKTYDLKRKIIENSLYGVDIDSSAVDITKLRLWLSLIVDEEHIDDIKPLPNLDHKIMCGNSLLEEYNGIKLFDEKYLLEKASDKKELVQSTLFDERLNKSRKKLKDLKKIQKLYFNEQNKRQKDHFREEIGKIEWELIEETLREEGNDESIEKLEQYKKSNSKPFFLWKLYFAEVFQRENPGFDVVIANPPYVRQEKIKDIKKFLKKNYVTYTGVADLYVYFFEKGINILRNGGILAFISSNKFTRANYGRNLRKLILENELKLYNDYAGEKVFLDATVDPCVILIKKGYSSSECCVLVDNEFEISQNRLSENGWSFEKPEILDLRDKINQKGTKLKNIDGLKTNFGIKTGYNNAFVIDKETKNQLLKKDPRNKEIIKPLLRGKDIKKWNMDYKEFYLIFSRRGIDINYYPTIKKFLSPFKERLTPKNQGQEIGRKPGDYRWYEIQDTVDYYEEFEKEKIIWSDMAVSPSFFWDNNSYYSLNTIYIMTLDNKNFDLKYLLTLLNSNLLFWVFKQLGSTLGEKGLRYFKQFVEQLPIYSATPEQQKPLIEKADQMLLLNKDLMTEVNGFKNWLKNAYNIEKFSKKLDSYYELSLEEFFSELRKKKVNLDLENNVKQLEESFMGSLNIIKPLILEIEKTENELDYLVYDLYELTPEEIEIIENFNNSSYGG